MNKLLIGDYREAIKLIWDDSVSCIITSPPYWRKRKYSEQTGEIGCEPSPDAYVKVLSDIFIESFSKLKEDGTFFLNIADSYIDGCVAPCSWDIAMNLRSAGFCLRQCIVWSKPNPKPESVKSRFTNSHEYVFFFTKSPRHYFDWEANAEDVDPSKWGISKDMKYNGKDLKDYAATKAEKPSNIKQRLLEKLRSGEPIKKNMRSVWTIPSPSYRGSHTATFPEELVSRCIAAGSPKGGWVLDPFGGSGTVAGVANKLGRSSIICEINPAMESEIQTRVSLIAGPSAHKISVVSLCQFQTA